MGTSLVRGALSGNGQRGAAAAARDRRCWPLPGQAVVGGWPPERVFRGPWNPLARCMHARLAAGASSRARWRAARPRMPASRTPQRMGAVVAMVPAGVRQAAPVLLICYLGIAGVPPAGLGLVVA